MAAHDCILDARVKQTHAANRHRRAASFSAGDFVYLSTKNLSLPAGALRKLAPRYIGPFEIERVIVDGSSYRLKLPEELLARGITPTFHASLLRIYLPSKDGRFPGRSLYQLSNLMSHDDQWTVVEILGHYGKGKELLFEVKWSTGHVTWERLREVKGLVALDDYLLAMGVGDVRDLPVGRGKPRAVEV